MFIYSFSEDPNICQLSLHKPWMYLVFAWVTKDTTFVFRIPKKELTGLSINHADGQMMQANELFKHSIRLKNSQIHSMTKYLIDIINVS